MLSSVSILVLVGVFLLFTWIFSIFLVFFCYCCAASCFFSLLYAAFDPCLLLNFPLKNCSLEVFSSIGSFNLLPA